MIACKTYNIFEKILCCVLDVTTFKTFADMFQNV